MKRASKKEMAQREQDICQLIAIGLKRTDISDELAAKYKVSKIAIERQYDRIINDWITEEKDKLDLAKAQYIMQLRHLHQKAVEAGQWKTAAEIVEKQAKMMGLYNIKSQTQEDKPEINIVPRSLTVVPKAENGD